MDWLDSEVPGSLLLLLLTVIVLVLYPLLGLLLILFLFLGGGGLLLLLENRTLLEYVPLLVEPFKSQEEKLFEAIKDDDARLVREILIERKSVHPDAFYKPTTWYTKFTPLMYAAKLNAIKSVDVILAAGADMNKADASGCTALIYAAREGNRQCLGRLLAAGADFNKQTFNGKTALMYAAEENKRECVNRLLAAGADVNHPSMHPLFFKEALLFEAIWDDDARLVREILIIRKSVHPDAFSNQVTPLMYAAKLNAIKSFDVILAAGAGVYKQNSVGKNALMLAAQENTRECLDKLLAAGADVNKVDSDGETALMYAVRNRALECLDRLLAAGAGVNKQTSVGRSALMFAAEKNAPECLDKLLAAGADVNITDAAGWTAQMWAAKFKAHRCVDKLLAASSVLEREKQEKEKEKEAAELREKKKRKEKTHHDTALMHTAENYAHKCVDKLLAAGADMQLMPKWIHTFTGSVIALSLIIIIRIAIAVAVKAISTAVPKVESSEAGWQWLGATLLAYFVLFSLDKLLVYRAGVNIGPTENMSKSTQDLELLFSDLSVDKELGRGAFGVVKLAELHQIQVAVKIFSTTGHNDDPMTTEVLQEMEREADLLGNLRHPNVVLMVGICRNPPCIVMEYCSKGSLSDVISHARTKSNNMHNQLTWRRRVGLARDVALGMNFLHSRQQPVIHRDLKSPNILVDGNWTAKVADLNLSRALKRVDETGRVATMSTALRPTNYRWLAPELLDPATRASPASDVYALGIIMWELLTWQIPFGPSIEPLAMVACLSRGKKLDIPALNELPGPEPASVFPGLTKYIDLMKHCWSQDPKERPAMAEVASALRELLAGLSATTTEEPERSNLPVSLPHEKGPKIIVYLEIQKLLSNIVDSSGPFKDAYKDASYYYSDIRMLKRHLGSVSNIFTKEPAIKISIEKWHKKLTAASKSYQLTDQELADMNRDFHDVWTDYIAYLQNLSSAASYNGKGKDTDGNVAAGGEEGAAATSAMNDCVICQNERAVIALIHHIPNQGNIAHMCCCVKCSENLQSRRLLCPMCRKTVDGIVRVY